FLRRLPARRADDQRRDERDRQGRIRPHAAGPSVRPDSQRVGAPDEGRQPGAAPEASLRPADGPPGADRGADLLLQSTAVSGPRATRQGGRDVPEGAGRVPGIQRSAAGAAARSEEHTSELQSRENLVCRLLLEKKNKKKKK